MNVVMNVVTNVVMNVVTDIEIINNTNNLYGDRFTVVGSCHLHHLRKCNESSTHYLSLRIRIRFDVSNKGLSSRISVTLILDETPLVEMSNFVVLFR